MNWEWLNLSLYDYRYNIFPGLGNWLDYLFSPPVLGRIFPAKPLQHCSSVLVFRSLWRIESESFRLLWEVRCYQRKSELLYNCTSWPAKNDETLLSTETYAYFFFFLLKTKYEPLIFQRGTSALPLWSIASLPSSCRRASARVVLLTS